MSLSQTTRMGSQTHYSTCDDRPSDFSQQDSRAKLLPNPSDSSNDIVFQEKDASALLSIRSGSDQLEAFAAIPPVASFHRRNACQESGQYLTSARRLSLQERPLPSIPTPYNNVSHSGSVRNSMTRPFSVPNEIAQMTSSGTVVRPPLPLPVEPQPPIAKSVKCVKLGICLVVTACFLSGLASAFSVYTYVTACHHHQTYCLLCSHLTPKPSTAKDGPDYQGMTELVDGQEMCCVNSNDDLVHLVLKVQQREKMKYVASQNITSAHVGLYADYTDDKAGLFHEGTHYTLLISNKSALQHYQNVEHGLKMLSILTSGRYFVYSSIHFNLTEYPWTCNHLAYKTWVHNVYVSSGSYGQGNRAILRSEHTCCEACAEESNSGFTGGVFELFAGDKLFVDVSAPPLVIDSTPSSYLGLFMVEKQ